MIKHIVLFRLASELSGEEKSYRIAEIKKAFEKLPDRIGCLHDLSISPNLNPKEPFDFALVATLDDLVDVNSYANHPEHVDLVGKLIKPYLHSRAAVDIEV